MASKPYRNSSNKLRDLKTRYKETMAIDYVRGGNPRCPSLIVGVLSVLCIFFACSWWSLTSQNFELLSQISDLEDQLKISGEELDKCAVLKASMDERTKALQNEAATAKLKFVQMEGVEEDLRTLLQRSEDFLAGKNKKIDNLESSLHFKDTELESLKKLSEAKNKTLESLRAEKRTLSNRLSEEESKVKALREELASLRKEKGIKTKDKVVSMVKDQYFKTLDTASAGIVVDGNHDTAAAIDENVAAEKVDAPAPDPVVPVLDNIDPREQAMKMDNINT